MRLVVRYRPGLMGFFLIGDAMKKLLSLLIVFGLCAGLVEARTYTAGPVKFKDAEVNLLSADLLNLIPSSEEHIHKEGQIHYDSTTKTFSGHIDISDVTLNFGEENWGRGRNNSGGQIDNGEVVYVSGALGNRPTFGLAKADSFATSLVLGVATHDMADNGEGIATTFGLVRDVDTTGDNESETWLNGDLLYVSATIAGKMTKVEPVNPNLSLPIAIVLNAHKNQGLLLVRAHFPTNILQVNGIATRDDHGTITTTEDFSSVFPYHTITTGTSHIWTLSDFTFGRPRIDIKLVVTGGTPTITLPGGATIATDSPQNLTTIATGTYILKVVSFDNGTSYEVIVWQVS